ncbi:MAG: (d)CMP kinase [Clostridia bacterium]|nr:(d)CMP kinase [Clostridia bacterium]
MDKKHIISITGDLASGKTTVTKYLINELGYSIYKNGEKFRAMAKEMNMSVSEFGDYVAAHPEIDIELDNYARKYGEENDYFIIDARLGFYTVPNSFKVYLKVDQDEGARRAFNDPDRKSTENFATVEEYKEDMIKRYNGENERYINLYGVNRADMSNYDLVVDTTNMTREEVKDKILEEYKNWIGEV